MIEILKIVHNIYDPEVYGLKGRSRVEFLARGLQLPLPTS